MIKVKEYTHKVKVLVRSGKKQIKKASKSKYAKDKRFLGAAVFVVVVVIFWGLPVYAAKAPGQLGYPIKRGEEAVAVALAPLPSWRDRLQLDFANNRVAEATYVASQANQSDDKNQAEAATTITNLLDAYENAYEARRVVLNQKFENGTKLSKSDVTEAQKAVVTTYAALQVLRLEAPDASQLAVLTALDEAQQTIATLSDAQGVVPLSASDFSQLAKLTSSGIVAQSDVDQLTGVTSNRQLHAQVIKLVEGGRAPSDLSYILDLDLVKKYVPDRAQIFETAVQFEQLQRISAVITASRPTADQQKNVQVFLASYTAGKPLPDSDIHQYVTPIVEGMVLAGQLQTNLPSLSAIHMNGDDQALFDSWKGVLDPPNLSETYQKLMTDAQSQPALHLRLLTTTQQELVDAQKAQVAYLVMPPGWNTGQFRVLDDQMGTEIAEVSYQQSNPSIAQELARLTTVQQQLQTQLDSLSTAYTDSGTKLQTQINNFNGTPEQLAQLKGDLAGLGQSQTTTINNLQVQLKAVTDVHTKLGDSIQSLRQEQVTNLTELELRAATHAQTLTDSAKAQLTASLAQVDSRNQALTTTLQTRVDNLGSGHDQLRSQLTTEIATIKNNYQQLKTDVQAQLDAGVATSGQLQSTLTQAQTSLGSHQTQLALLSSNATALSQLVDQVKTDSTSQVQDLRSQINVVTLNQQTTNAAVSELRTVTTSSQSLITALQTRVDGLAVSHTSLSEELTGTLQTVQNNYTQLSAYTQAQLDAGVATSAQLQTNLQTIQTNLDQHSAQLANLASGNAALTRLIDQLKTDSSAQESDLHDQISGLAIGQQAIRTSLNSLQDKQTADITQLSSQLAGLSVLQVEAQATIASLMQAQVQAQASINHLNTNFDSLQTAFDVSLQAQIAIQANIAGQAAAIDGLQTQMQTALAALTQQQDQLAGQLTALAATTTTLSQAVSTVQTASTATQTQLTTLLANPPWALATAAYVTQTQLDSLSAHLDTLFAQKSAQLDQQFQAYKTELNATVSQLNSQVQSLNTTTSSTATTQSQQQTQITTLNSQIQTLQTRVQALTSASTPPGTGL